MSRKAWTIYRPEVDATFRFPVNPYQDNGSFGLSRSTSYEAHAATYRDNAGTSRVGNVVSFAANEIRRFSFEGYVYTDLELFSLILWTNDRNAVILTDDLGRSFSVLFDGIDLSRVRSSKYPHKHRYTLSGIVLEEL